MEPVCMFPNVEDRRGVVGVAKLGGVWRLACAAPVEDNQNGSLGHLRGEAYFAWMIPFGLTQTHNQIAQNIIIVLMSIYCLVSGCK